jgi:hypothetical protein
LWYIAPETEVKKKIFCKITAANGNQFNLFCVVKKEESSRKNQQHVSRGFFCKQYEDLESKRQGFLPLGILHE